MKLGGEAFMLSLVLGTGLAPFTKPAFAGQLEVLTDEESATLLSVARTLFPHDTVQDAYYMNVVAAIDAKCAKDEKMRAMVKERVVKLNTALGMPFTRADETARTNLLRTMEKSDFFQLAYTETLNNLYGNHEIWQKFGYEGASVEQGGYLERGFDDIAWLPKS
ncbi:MAG: gluconate 2-dehydrogenase subunit 3 family protein [Betaproteobacteria bacterium]